jgi:hypothetical protein
MRAVAVLVMAVTACSYSASAGYTPVFGPGKHPCDRFDTTARADFTGGVLAGILGGALLAAASGGGADSAGVLVLPVAGGSLAVLAFASGVHGLHERDRCLAQGHALELQARSETATRVHREQAWKLTQEAEAAARDDDCATVARLDGEIAAADQGVHDDVFARDAAVARCRGSAP